MDFFNALIKIKIFPRLGKCLNINIEFYYHIILFYLK